MVKRFFEDESGQSMLEYAMIIAFIAIIVIAAVKILGQTVNSKFEEINEKFDV